MSMMKCPNCDNLVDSDENPEICPKCEAELFPKVRREPPADFMERLAKDSESECDECGKAINDGMNCPDGSFICYECFNQGLH